MLADNIYLPFKTSVTNVQEVAKNVKLFSIGVPADFTYQAGQFVMVSVDGRRRSADLDHIHARSAYEP